MDGPGDRGRRRRRRSRGRGVPGALPRRRGRRACSRSAAGSPGEPAGGSTSTPRTDAAECPRGARWFSFTWMKRPRVARDVDVVVIGAGQAGLSAAYHLRRRGFHPVDRRPRAPTFVVLDAERRARRSVAAPLGIPAHGHGQRHPRAARASRCRPPIRRPEPRRASAVLRRVRAPVRPRRAAARRPCARCAAPGTASACVVETDDGAWSARHVINATGTWSRPFWPHYPGRELLPRPAAPHGRLRLGRGVRGQAGDHRGRRRVRRSSCSTRSPAWRRRPG